MLRIFSSVINEKMVLIKVIRRKKCALRGSPAALKSRARWDIARLGGKSRKKAKCLLRS